jgi:hypothetical protein
MQVQVVCIIHYTEKTKLSFIDTSSLAKGYDPLYPSSFKRKEMKASRRLAENDIITRGVTVKIQKVAVRGNYENPTNDAKGEDG